MKPTMTMLSIMITIMVLFIGFIVPASAVHVVVVVAVAAGLFALNRISYAVDE